MRKSASQSDPVVFGCTMFQVKESDEVQNLDPQTPSPHHTF